MPTIRVPGVNTAPAVEPQTLPTGGAGLEGQAIRQGAAAIASGIDAVVVQPMLQEEAEQDRLRAKTDLQAFDLALKDAMTQATREIEDLDPTFVDREVYIDQKLKESFDSLRDDFLARPGITESARDVLEVSGDNLREIARQGLDQVFEGRVEDYREGVARRSVEDSIADAISSGSVDALLERLPTALEGTRLANTPDGQRLLQGAARSAVSGILVQGTPESQALAQRLVMGEDEALQRALGSGYSNAVATARDLESQRIRTEVQIRADQRATIADMTERPWAAGELWTEAEEFEESLNDPYIDKVFGPSASVIRAQAQQSTVAKYNAMLTFKRGSDILSGEALSTGAPQDIDAADAAFQAAGGLPLLTPNAVVATVKRAGMLPALGRQIATALRSDDPALYMVGAESVMAILEENELLIDFQSERAGAVKYLETQFSPEALSRIKLAVRLSRLGMAPAEAMNAARTQGAQSVTAELYALERDGSLGDGAQSNIEWLQEASKSVDTLWGDNMKVTAELVSDWEALVRTYRMAGISTLDESRQTALNMIMGKYYLAPDGTVTKNAAQLKGAWAVEQLKQDMEEFGYDRREISAVEFRSVNIRGRDVYVPVTVQADGSVNPLLSRRDEDRNDIIYLEADADRTKAIKQSALDRASAIGDGQLKERQARSKYLELTQTAQFRITGTPEFVEWPFDNTAWGDLRRRMRKVSEGIANGDDADKYIREIQYLESVAREDVDRAYEAIFKLRGMGDNERADLIQGVLKRAGFLDGDR